MAFFAPWPGHEFNFWPREDDGEDYDAVIAIFVTRFDTLRGNMIEFQYPPEMDLSGVEYKCIPSGSHQSRNDIIYFTHGDYCGIAALEQVLLDDSTLGLKERGARVKAVGLLCTSYTSLHCHLAFLQEQVERFVRKLGDPSDLSDYFLRRIRTRIISMDGSLGLPELQALLQKRIIFYATPPVNQLCLDADIPNLSHSSRYIACTTEPIFESKEALYDLFVKQDKLIYPKQYMNEGNSSPVLSSSPSSPIAFAARPISSHSKKKSNFQVNDMDKLRFEALRESIIGVSNHPSPESPGTPSFGTISNSSHGLSETIPLPTSKSFLHKFERNPRRNTVHARSLSINLLEESFSIKTISKKPMRIAVLEEEATTDNIFSHSASVPRKSDHLRRLSTILAKNEDSKGETEFVEGVSDQVKRAIKIIEFFHKFNSNLFHSLSILESSSDPTLRSCKMKSSLGLCPNNDEHFIRQLIVLYGFNIRVELQAKKFMDRAFWNSSTQCQCCPKN